MAGDFFKRGGLWVLGQSVLMLVNVAAPLWHWTQPVLWRSLCGLFLLAVAAACGISGVLCLGRSLTAFPHPASRTRLVHTGIYGLMRHPLYAAVMAWAMGWTLLWPSWPGVGAALAMTVFLDAKARTEERRLRQHFPEYATYEKRVRRFLPGLY